MVKKLIRKIHAYILHYFRLQLERNNFEVKHKTPPEHHQIVLENYFHTQHSRNALIAYVVNPFLDRQANFHTNQAECYRMAELLNQAGYNVDIINWNNTTYIPNKTYAVVIDNHDTIERLYLHFKETTKIFHISSCHWLYQNTREIERINAIKDKRGAVLRPTRLLTATKSYEMCDLATCLGNSFTADTYGFAQKPIHFIPVSSTAYFSPKPKRNYAQVKYKFLWFGSKGFALKGLDVVLETFVQFPHLQLSVCAPLHTEPEFCAAYDHELYHTPNIHTIGWVEIPSERFTQIIEEHSAVISLSFSEGGGAAVITCMHGGLIPIVSMSNSIDVHDFGFWTRDINTITLNEMLTRYVALSPETLESMSDKAYYYAVQHHTLEKFSEKMNEIIVSLNKEI